MSDSILDLMDTQAELEVVEGSDTHLINNEGDNDEGGQESTSTLDDPPPYVPIFDDYIKKMITIDPTNAQFEKFFAPSSSKEPGRFLAEVIPVGPIKFDVELERVEVDRDDHKDLIVHIVCHREGIEPHWRCTFQCEISATVGLRAGDAKGMKTDARLKDNCLTMPLMRMPAKFDQVELSIHIKLTSWKGFTPRLIHDFTKKSKYTNATLIIEDQSLFVTREIVSIHSSYFNTLFNNDCFSDSAKTEYELSDVSYSDMLLLLNLTYPETMVGRRETFITCFADIERILHLSEQFIVPSFKNLAERMLRDAHKSYPEITWTRLLYIADRFRLSETCSAQMRCLNRESNFIRLRHSEEFDLLTDRLRSKILTSALDLLPPSTSRRTVKIPSRTGRIGQFSDVEEDEEVADVEVIRSVTNIRPRFVAPSPNINVPPFNLNQPYLNHSQQLYQSLMNTTSNFQLPQWPPVPPVQPQQPQNRLRAAFASTSAVVSSQSTPIVASTSTNGISQPALARLVSLTSGVQAPINIPLNPSSGSSRSDPRVAVNASNAVKDIKRLSMILTDTDIKEEDDSEMDDDDEDDQPGPSNQSSKITRKRKSGVTTRSRATKKVCKKKM